MLPVSHFLAKAASLKRLSKFDMAGSAGPELLFDRRTLLAGGAAMGLLAPAAAAANPEIIVSTSGRPGTQPTLTAALAVARSLRRPASIRIEAGLYQEKPIVDIPGLHLAGEGPDSVVSYGAAAGLPDPQGRKWGTGGSATLTVTAPGVTLARMTIRNSFDYLKDKVTNASGGAQAVALSVARGADRIIVRDCTIQGYQDTLYVQEMCRAWFSDCRISGNIDFIFGGATALFDRCELKSRFAPGAAIQGYIAAPSTPKNVPAGLVFEKCSLVREALVPDHSVFLGRPWRAGGNMRLLGAAAFLDCWMDAHICGEGWSAMGYTNPAGIRAQLTPQEARLFEGASLGPGAGRSSPARRLLSTGEMRFFQRDRLFGDWHPWSY